MKNYFENVSPFIPAALSTVSVSLWTITIINFNRALENLDAMEDFNFTNIQLLLLLQSSLKPLLSEESLADKFH